MSTTKAKKGNKIENEDEEENESIMFLLTL